jgi:hypothetical protein
MVINGRIFEFPQFFGLNFLNITATLCHLCLHILGH